jgi:L-seryl-tRNA(Ser) seleniumtransferase
LVDAAMMHSFVGFEYGPPRTMGRGMKVDRQEIVGMVTALREWMAMDHRVRFATYQARADRLMAALSHIPHIELDAAGDPVTGVRVKLDPNAFHKSVAQIADELKAGNPSIWFHWDLSMYVKHQEPNTMIFSVETLVDGDEEIVAEKLGAVLQQ